jgi:hypothetical protein
METREGWGKMNKNYLNVKLIKKINFGQKNFTGLMLSCRVFGQHTAGNGAAPL